MAGFYKPFTTKIKNKPIIVYPCIGIEKVLDRNSSDSIENHLESLYSINSNLLTPGEYHIVILWDEASDNKNADSVDVMSDIWIFDKLDSWGSGPLVDVKIFRNMKWIRASKSGLFHSDLKLGSKILNQQNIGEITNIFGDHIAHVKSPCSGMIVGLATNPKVHQGDAIVHIAKK